MEIKKKKSSRLFYLFLSYLAIFISANLLCIILLLMLLSYGFTSGILLPANYAEQSLKQAREVLETSEPFDSGLIPSTCVYAKFDDSFQFQEGTMNEKEQEKARSYMLMSGYSNTYPLYYLQLDRDDGNYIIQYDILAHFASPALHRLFSRPELLPVIFFFCFLFLSIGITSARFGKKLKSQLSPLIEATDMIKNQDLDFEVAPTDIIEFNAVLDSIASLRDALKHSLKQKWNDEQNQKAQLSALAHDIKTPLTLISGNSELLLESELSADLKDLTSIIHSNAKKIEHYTALLMETASAGTSVSYSPEYFLLSQFLDEFNTEARSLCKRRDIHFSAGTNYLPEKYYGDRTLIFRSLMNILDNAVQHSSSGDNITCTAEYKEKNLIFSVTDNGIGFSLESLKSACQPFYTEHKERPGSHYGMGLFLAKTAAEKHDGQLLLANRKDKSGAVVTLILSETQPAQFI